jgi:hypothetical protein
MRNICLPVYRENDARETSARELSEKCHTSLIWMNNEIGKRDQNQWPHHFFFSLLLCEESWKEKQICCIFHIIAHLVPDYGLASAPVCRRVIIHTLGV